MEQQMYTFHKTVRGHLHIVRELPCEDFSESCSENIKRKLSCKDSSVSSSENIKYYIAIVADGHGAAQCFRSNIGSEMAVNIAKECLQNFAKPILESVEKEKRFYEDIFENLRYRKMILRQLTDTILTEWKNCVLEHYKKNPPSLEESKEEKPNDIFYMEENRNITHIYGTTLLAALMLPSCMILLHQGDGRCDVFFEDGTIEQPIPWDSRCEDTTTTSLCDEDAAESVRTYIFNLGHDITEKNKGKKDNIEKEKRRIIACYLGCDGVEDAYRDTYEGLGGSHVLMGGVHTFYKDLTCQIAMKGTEEFEEYLKTMLSEFSEHGRFSHSGSGDDISVAGIVDKDAIKSLTQRFKRDIKQYALEEDLFWKEDELRGKTRKHEILQKRMEEAGESVKILSTKLKGLEIQCEDMEMECAELEKQIAHVEQNLKQKVIQIKQEAYNCEKDFKHITEDKNKSEASAEKPRYMFLGKLRCVCEEFIYKNKEVENRYQEMLKRKKECENAIQQLHKDKKELIEKKRIADQNYEQAENNFKDYHAEYQKISETCQEIQDKIKVLLEQSI